MKESKDIITIINCLEEDMKKEILYNPLKTGLQVILLLAISIFSLGASSAKVASAKTSSSVDFESTACGQLLAEAEAGFLGTLSADGSVPASPEAEAAAQEYIRVSKLCYEEMEAQNPAQSLQEETPTFIDDGGVTLESETSAEFALTESKWGSSTLGTSGGTVTYSFMGNGISFSAEGYGNSTALTSLPNFQACFITEIQNAFTAWQAVANIEFVQVTDSGAAFNGAGATGDIRIGAHAFDGASGTLAHAYYPPPNGNSAAGDMHFDSAENWTCNTSGMDIGVVALHEIGHSLGLGHERTTTIALMNPYYNSSLNTLQSDDINGSTAIYGSATLAAAPVNDNFANAKTVGSVPYADALDTTGAADAGDGPTVPAGLCSGVSLRKGTKNVWYNFTSPITRSVSFDTLGTNYDTYIAVWTGSNIGSLTLVGCRDDNDAGLQAQISFTAQANVTYRIEVAQYNGTISGSSSPGTGGNLQFHATSFEDVPGTFWAWRFIEGLYAAGVTSGCSTSPLLYCPATTVTRDQMAVFLLRAKHGAGYVPPAATGVFQDVPTNYWAAAWIERLAAEGITGGCSISPKLYCPTTPVTRDQMAVFLLRAKYGAGYVPPAATGVFQDVPTNYWAASWIERLSAEAITGGCSAIPKLYCPTTAVSRDQMAVFLDRTFSLPLLP